MAAFKLFGVLVYDTNDDTIMASLSYGYYGVPEEKLIYIHPLLGTFMAALQRTVPAFPWYYLVELGILGLSITALYWMVLRKKEIKQVLPELAVLTVLLVQTMLFRLQYTKIAGCASAVGMLLMFQAAEDRRRWGLFTRNSSFAFRLLPAGYGLRHGDDTYGRGWNAASASVSDQRRKTRGGTCFVLPILVCSVRLADLE